MVVRYVAAVAHKGKILRPVSMKLKLLPVAIISTAFGLCVPLHRVALPLGHLLPSWLL